MTDFQVWKTIRIGTGLETADDFRHAFKENGCRICEPSNGHGDIIDQPGFTVTKECVEVDIVIVSTAELGFKRSVLFTTKDIYKRVLDLGMQLCPAEVGPQLRLQYKEQGQHKGQFGTLRLIVGMQRILAQEMCVSSDESERTKAKIIKSCLSKIYACCLYLLPLVT